MSTLTRPAEQSVLPAVSTAVIAPRFVDTPTVAGDLGVTTQTVRNMVRRGELRGVRIGGRLRIPVDDYMDYLRRVGAVDTAAH